MVLNQETHSTILNGESRMFIYPDHYPFTAICKLVSQSQERPGGDWSPIDHATGFLVGRRTIMTSGHAHPDTSAYAWRIQVIPACYEGRSIFGEGFYTYVRNAHWWHSDGGNDFMVGELYDPIGDDVGYFGAIEYTSDWEDLDVWTMSGYPFDMDLWMPSYETAISVRDDDDGDDIQIEGATYDTTQVENNADEASGGSGSPLFAWFNDGRLMAVGVHSGYQEDGTAVGMELLSCASGGIGFVEVIRWARVVWG